MTLATGSNRGFTLLELLVVLAVLLLLTVAWPFAAPRLFPAQQLRTEGQELCGAFRFARATAQMSGSEQSVTIAAGGDSYNDSKQVRELPHGMLLGDADGDPLQEKRSEPIEIQFFADGSSTGAHLRLTYAQRQVTLRVGRLIGGIELTP